MHYNGLNCTNLVLGIIFLSISMSNPNALYFDRNFEIFSLKSLQACTAVTINFSPSSYSYISSRTSFLTRAFMHFKSFQAIQFMNYTSASMKKSTKIRKFSAKQCSLVLLEKYPGETNEGGIMLLKLLNGIVWGFDRDYFVFLSPYKNILITLLKNPVISNQIKYKIGIAFDNNHENKTILTSCFYCGPNGSPNIIQLSSSDSKPDQFEYFPDLLRNFDGKVFRISISSKAHDLNQIREVSPGIWKPYRGLFSWTYWHLSRRLNFTGTFFPSAGGDGTGLKFPNGTWNGICGDVLYGNADFGYALGQVYSRNSIIDFSYPVTYTRLLFVTGIPQPTYTWKAIYLPLEPQVWGYVIGSSCATHAALVGIVKSVFHMNKQKSSLLIGHALAYLLTTILEQSQGELDRANSVRTVSAFWLIFGILVTTAYRSKLVSVISFPVLEQPPKSFVELGRSPVGQYGIYLHFFGGAAFEIFKSSASPVFRAISSRMHLEKDSTKCFQTVVGTVHKVCIAWESVVTYVFNRNFTDKNGNTPIVKAPDSSSFIIVAIGVPKMSVLKEKFDTVISRAVALGLTEKWVDFDRDFLLNKRRKWEKSLNIVEISKAEDDTGIEALRLEHLRGTFYMWGIGTSFSFVWYLIEFLERPIE